MNGSEQIYSGALNACLHRVLSLAKSKNYLCTETCAMKQIIMAYFIYDRRKLPTRGCDCVHYSCLHFCLRS